MLSYAEARRQYGTENYNPPSRFINEVPAELMTEVRPRAMVSRAVTPPGTRQSRSNSKYRADSSETGLKIGQRVSHSKFGEGIILDQEGSGTSARVHVKFVSAGSKWLVLAYAKLTKL